VENTKPYVVVIQGVNREGKVFRPSDWAERLCGCMSTYGPFRRVIQSPYVSISMAGGVKSLVVEQGLWETNPLGYEFLMGFARDNGLKVQEEAAPELAKAS